MSNIPFSFVKVPEGASLYTVGGYDSGYFDDCDCFDKAGNSWSNKAAITVAAYYISAIAIGSSKGYLFCSANAGSFYDNACESYTQSTNSWASITAYPETNGRTSNGRAVPRSSGIAYVYNGRSNIWSQTTDCKSYTANSDSWATKTSTDAPAMWGLGSASIGTNYCYRYYGVAMPDCSTKYHFDDCERYSVSGNSWVARTAGPGSDRYLVVGDSVGADSMLALGGKTGSPSSTADCDMYTESSNSWTGKTDIVSPTRQSGGAARIGSNYIYYVYGYQQAGTGYLKDCDEYNYSGNSWATKTDGPTPEREFSGNSTVVL